VLNAMPKPTASRDESAAHPLRLADTASSRLWLAEGFPIADVLITLEAPRPFEFTPHDSRGSAAETLLTVWHGIDTNIQPQITHREEQHHAIA
jgi:hypothetical protein